MQASGNPVSTLLARLRQALSDPDERADGPDRALQAASPEPGPPADFRVADRPTFERRLHETLMTRGLAAGGRVQLLNLSVLASRFGPRWPQVSEKIDQLAEIAVRRRLGAHDYFTKCDNGIYVIVFEAIPESEAKLRCALLAEEIMGRLIGTEPGPEEIQVASAAARIDGSIELTPFNKLDALQEIMAAAPAYVARPDTPEGQAARLDAIGELARVAGRDLLDRDALPPDQRRADSPERLARIDRLLPLMREAEAFLKAQGGLYAAGDPLLADLTGTPPAPEATEAAERHDPAAGRPLLEVMADLIERAEDELKDRHPAPHRPGDALAPDGLVFRYQPVWNTARKMVFAYHCGAGLEHGGRVLTGADLLGRDPAPQLVGAYDRLILRKAMADIAAALGAGRRVMVIIPVHHGTLIRPMARYEYAAMCEAIDSEMRRCIVWEIVEPSLGLSNANLPPAVALLKQHGRVVLVRLPAEYAHFGDFAATGIHAVGLDLAPLDLRDKDMARQLTLFRARSQRYGLRSYVRGVHSPALVSTAASEGYDYVDGPAILTPLEAPGPFRELELAEIHARWYAREAGLKVT
jgi:EAL domain-containing protein (putative c-di-GMP-specific phosphodiesterase class I)